MPVIKDNNGSFYHIPASEMGKYKITKEEAEKLEAVKSVPIPGRDSDDVELQSRSQWYSGD